MANFSDRFRELRERKMNWTQENAANALKLTLGLI